MKTLLLALVLAALLAGAVIAVAPAFARHGALLSVHGWIALAAGVLVSLVLGGGLMALSFYSSRRGYDERAQWQSQDEDPAD
jgi:hypothetical protein